MEFVKIVKITKHNMARWGFTERDGPDKILNHISQNIEVKSVLFVGAAHAVHYIPIIKKIKDVNQQCKIIFSDKYMISSKKIKEIESAGGEFLQIDVLQEKELDLNVDCTIAFGLFSPQVIWAKSAETALSNLIKMTSEKGLIVASTREQYALEFERFIESVNFRLNYEKSTGYDQDTVDKHAFAKGWKGNFMGHHYPGYEDYDSMIDAYLAYLNDQSKRTNFYIQRELSKGGPPD